MMLGHCNDLEVETSSFTSTDWSTQDTLFSNIITAHTILEGNENKGIIQSNVVYQNNTINTSSKLQINKETIVNKTNTNLSHQFLDNDVEIGFSHGTTSSRADRNSKRLILDNFLSAELQTDTVISRDVLLNNVAGSPKCDVLSENILKVFNEDLRNVTNSTSNDDEENTQQKNITSTNDDYSITKDPLPFQQNTILTNFYEDKPENYKQNKDLENFIITTIEYKNIRMNVEKYDEQITLNKDISEDNTQHTSSGEDPVEVTSIPTSDYGDISDEPKQTTKKHIKIAKIIRLKQTVAGTAQKLPVTNTQEIDNQSSVENGKDVRDGEKYKNATEKDVYVDTDLSSVSNIDDDHVQPSHEIVTNGKGGKSRAKRSPTVYPRVAFSDSSSRRFPYDKGTEMRSNKLMIKDTQSQQVSQGVLKPPILQQPGVGHPQTDPDLDLLKNKFARAERLSKAFKWLIQFVNIVGQVDSYLTDRTRTIVRSVARLYDGDDHRGRSRSCD
jgi:hypothetical protein